MVVISPPLMNDNQNLCDIVAIMKHDKLVCAFSPQTETVSNLRSVTTTKNAPHSTRVSNDAIRLFYPRHDPPANTKPRASQYSSRRAMSPRSGIPTNQI